MLFDDSDVKIFTDSDTSPEASHEVHVIAEMTKHRSNGNIMKAKNSANILLKFLLMNQVFYLSLKVKLVKSGVMRMICTRLKSFSFLLLNIV